MSNYRRILEDFEVDGQKVDTSNLDETGKVMIGDEEWDASDLVTDEVIMDDFEQDAMKNKQGILISIRRLLRDIDENSKKDTKHSPEYYTRYKELVERFRDTIDKCVFPENLETGWYYELEAAETGIKLWLMHTNSCELNEEGFSFPEDIDAEYEILHVNTRLMTVEQYAQAYEVTPTTVRQWIRRGKIRSAMKAGSEWRIPELAEIRERGYCSAMYTWDEYLSDIPEEYVFMNDYNSVFISQNEERKDLFDISFYTKDKKKWKEMQMDQKEREKFELLLIANPFVKHDSNTIIRLC